MNKVLTVGVALFLLILRSFSNICTASVQLNELQKEFLAEIEKETYIDGKPEAMLRASSISPEIALPFLEKHLRSNKEERGPIFESARASMLKVPGAVQYFQHKAAEGAKQSYINERSLETLSLLGTVEAQAAIAPFLFDFTTSNGSGHIPAQMFAPTAALYLGLSGVADSPIKSDPRLYETGHIIAWQQWAESKGYKPLGKQVGAPSPEISSSL